MRAPLAALPFVELPDLDLGFARLSPFALFAVLGAAAGIAVALVAARARGLPTRVALPAALAGVAGGGLAAHLAAVALYRPDLLRAEPVAQLLSLGNGGASMGGILGGAAAAALWCRIARRRVAPVLDVLAVGAALGFAIGRVGCALVHDHPGRPSGLAFAVEYPGGARLDLGLVEAGAFGLLALALGVAARRVRRAGRLAAGFALGYGPARFALDSLRVDVAGAAELTRAGWPTVADPRYGGLTPAQWLALGLVAGGLALLRQRPRAAAQTS